VGGRVGRAERETDGEGLVEIVCVAGAGEAGADDGGREVALAGDVGGGAAGGGDGRDEAGCSASWLAAQILGRGQADHSCERKDRELHLVAV